MASHHKRTEAEVDALDAYIKLMRSSESVTARVHEVLPPRLTVTQFAVLETLLHLGPLCPSQLASKLLKSTGNLTLVVANLEKARLVQRERDPNDLRFVTVSLTSKGRTYIETLFPKVARRITEEFRVLTPAEQASLARLCKKLGLGNIAVSNSQLRRR